MMAMMMTLNFCAVLLLSLLMSSLSYANPLQGSEYIDVCSIGGCPRIFSPICATDGADNFRYFHNECLMRLDECRTGTAWSETRMSLCLPQIDPFDRLQCAFFCPLIGIPFCATNGQSYHAFSDECDFRVENCLANGKWSAAPKSDCGL